MLTIKYQKLTLFLSVFYGVFCMLSSVMNFWVREFSEISNSWVKVYFVENLIEFAPLFFIMIGFKFVTGLLLVIPRTSAIGVLLACANILILLLYLVFFPPATISLSAFLDMSICGFLFYAFSDYYTPLVNTIVHV